jgi:FixJ family two-component response regulator
MSSKAPEPFMIAQALPTGVATQKNLMVRIVSADESFRTGVGNAVRDAGLTVTMFESAGAFLVSLPSGKRGCLLLDTDSVELKDEAACAMLIAAAATMPLVLIVREAGIPASIRVLKAMAVDVLLSPVKAHALAESGAPASQQDTHRSESDLRLAAMRTRYAGLTMREKQVLALVTEGLMNKQVAAMLGLQVITVKVHRATMMRKMRCRRLVELVRAADTLEIESPMPLGMQDRNAFGPFTGSAALAHARQP